MRIRIQLNIPNKTSIIPVNYQYPLSAAIYKILKGADSEYAAFLHEKGYGKGFKLFTFSDLKVPFRIKNDRLTLWSDKAELIICFHLPKAAETFIRGLFMSQQMEIADSKSRTVFSVRQVEMIRPALKNTDDETLPSCIYWPPSSPLFVG